MASACKVKYIFWLSLCLEVEIWSVLFCFVLSFKTGFSV